MIIVIALQCLPASVTSPISPISPTIFVSPTLPTLPDNVSIQVAPTSEIELESLEMLRDANKKLLNMTRNPTKMNIQGVDFNMLCKEYIHNLEDNSVMLFDCLVKVEDAQAFYSEFDVNFIYLPMIDKK